MHFKLQRRHHPVGPGIGLLLLALLCLFPPSLRGQDQAGAPVQRASEREIPSPAGMLGHELGERFTDVPGIREYLEALADASDRVRITEYGRTPEGRPLLQVVIASEENLAGLDEILARNRELTDPSTSEARARRIADVNPAVVYLSYGVHGDESSPSEAALWTAWDLARSAPGAVGILDSLVVVIDPVLNPDGRARYVGWYRQVRAVPADPDPQAWEHREPWPGGRFNHYLFDLNRDWAWMTQAETRARLATWDRWNPQVHVDFHEMSAGSTYFFFPPTAPINPIYPDHVLEWGRRFGAANADAFDRRGWLYFTGSTYDLFYPGYGDSWPSLLGSVGMTYEQAGSGSAGLVVEREDGTLLTLEERAEHHRVAGLATLRTAAEGRRALLEGFAATHRNVDAGLRDILLVSDGDRGGAEALVELLTALGIEVERAEEGFRADADLEPHPGYADRERFPAGTYRVRARQSRGRLAAALLRADNPLDAPDSYDITGWSLPYAYGVEAHAAAGSYGGSWTPVARPSSAGVEVGGGPAGSAGSGGASGPGAIGPGGRRSPAPVGFLVPSTFAAVPGVVRFLEAGGRAVRLAEAFALNGRSYEPGAWFLPRGRNPELERLVAESGLGGRAVPVATGRAGSGPDLGTESGRSVSLPRIALLGGEGTEPASFGAHWFFLERTVGLPFDIVRLRDVAELDLSRYDAVLAPSGGLAAGMGVEGVSALEQWIRSGGTLIAVGEGARSLAGPVAEVDLRQYEDGVDEADSLLERSLATRDERERERRTRTTRGAVLPVRLDPGHPLSWGAGAGGDPTRMFVLSTGRVFEPSTRFESPLHFPADVEQVSGMVSPEALARLSRGAWAVETAVGQGSVVLFAGEPLFRHFWHAGFQLVANALFLAGSG